MTTEQLALVDIVNPTKNQILLPQSNDPKDTVIVPPQARRSGLRMTPTQIEYLKATRLQYKISNNQ